MRKVNLRNVDPAIDDPDASTWCTFCPQLTAMEFKLTGLLSSTPHPQPPLTSRGCRQLQAASPSSPPKTPQAGQRSTTDSSTAFCDRYGSSPTFCTCWGFITLQRWSFARLLRARFLHTFKPARRWRMGSPPSLYPSAVERPLRPAYHLARQHVLTLLAYPPYPH